MAEAGVIDSLQIEIEASSKEAARQINNLANSLKKLKAATDQKLNIGNFKRELGKLGNNEYSKIEKLAIALNGLKNIKLDEKVGNGIAKIAEACDLIEQQHIDRLAGFGNALQSIKGVSTRGFDTLPAAILNIAAAVDSITDDSIERLRRLTDALGSLRGVDMKGMADVLKNQNEAKKLAQEAAEKAAKGEKEDKGDETETDKIENQISKIAQLKAKITEALKTSGINAAKSAWKAFAGTIANAARDGVHHIFSLTRAIQAGFLGTVAKAGKSVFTLAKNMATAPIQRFADRISELKKKLDSLGAAFARIMLYRGIRTVIKEMGEAMKYGEENAYWFSKKFGEATQYISEAYDAYASATEMMKNQVGAAWATLFANIQPIIEAITDMVARAAQVVTQFFAALGGKTSYLKATKYAKDWKEETEDATKAAKEWKNQIMGFDEINRLEEQSDGSSSKIKDNTPDYSKMFEEVAVDSEIGSLADRMKELWNSQDWKGLGELIAQTLNDLFPTEETWQKWGHKIGNGIDGAVQTAYYTLKGIEFGEWGRRIASGVNAALDEIEFEFWGRLLVRKTTAALDMAIGFIKGLEFDDLGKSIGDFFRGAFDEASEWLSQYEWGEMSGKLWEKIKSLIDGFDVPTFAQSLGNFIVTAANSAADFLNGIDFTDVVTTIETTLASFVENVKLDEVKAALGNLWEAVKKAFTDTMTTFGSWLSGKNEEGYFYQLGQDFNTGITNLINDADTLFDAVPWGEIGTAISDFLEGLDWLDIFKKTWGFIGGKMVEAVKWVFSSDGETVRHIGEALLGIKLAFTGAEAVLSLAAQALVMKILNPFKLVAPGVAASTAKTAGSLSGLKTAISGALPGIGTAALGVFDAVVGIFDIVQLSKISSEYGNALDTHLSSVENALASYNNLVSTQSKEVADQWASMVYQVDLSGKNLEDSQSELVNTVYDIWGDAPDTMWGGFIQGWKDYFGEGGSGIVGLLHDALTNVKNSVGAGEAKEAATGIGETLVGNMKAGIDENLPGITSSIETELPKTLGTVKDTFGEIKTDSEQKWGEIKNTVTNATGDINTQSVSDTKTLYNDVTGIYNDIDKEAVRVFTDIAKAVPQIMNYVSGEFKKSVDEMSSSMLQMYTDVTNTFTNIENTIAESINRIRSLMDFEWSIPRPKIPRITWNYETVYSGDGSSYQIPQFDVQWFAKGGVIDRKMLFGMGEDGAEAIVPLERNTEWISKVAQEMNRQKEQDSSANDDMTVTIYTAAAQIVQAIQEANGRRNNVSININGREFFRATYEDQQAVAREKGTSLIIA